MPSDEIELLLAWLGETPDVVTTLARDLDEATLRRQPSGDYFSFVETACHLRDLEREGYGVRIQRILAEDRPVLEDFDGTRVAEERDYQAQEFRSAIAEFAQARERNVATLRELQPAQFERGAELEGTGAITLSQIVEMMREHDRVHRQELADLREQLTGRAGAAG